jgi:glycosyltransferase involved in cell wall biosynthesis
VSVIIPTHSRLALLLEAIASLQAQTYSQWEAIVVDDRSTDDTFERVQALAAVDARIRLLRCTGVAGGAAARNEGIAAGRGAFVVFLDDDDMLAPHCLEQRVRVMQLHPELDFAVFGTVLFREHPGDSALMWNDDTGGNDIDRYLRKDIPWGVSGPIWKRQALDRVGPWDERALSGQDWEFHLRALTVGLKYRRFHGPDAYCRVRTPTRLTIGARAMGPEHQRRRGLVIGRIRAMLAERGMLTPRRRHLLAGHYHRVAMRLTVLGLRKEGMAFWVTCFREGLISPRLLIEGLVYMRFWHRRRFRGKMRSYVTATWPADIHFEKPYSFMHTPLPAGADRARADAMPVVSVLMAVYNQAAYVGQAIDSILGQTFEQFELVVVDDGSNDGTSAVIDDRVRRDPRIRLIRGPNAGTVTATSAGLAACRGRYVARMDGDDISHPDRLERQVGFLDAHPHVLAVGCRLELIDPFGAVIGRTENPLDHQAIDAALLDGRGGTVPQPAAMIRREALLQAGGYRRQYENSEDLDLWLRLAEVGELANLPDYLLKYRRHPLSISYARHSNQMRMKALIVGEAYDRRGLARPDEWVFHPWHPKPAAEQLQVWGWRSLKRGNLKAARTYAMDLVRLAPLSQQAWRLMFCALRGY